MIDTHVHLWDPARLHYAWHESARALSRAFLLDDYRQATAGLEIEAFVFLECDCAPDQRHDEVAWISELATVDSRLQGIVAQAPLELGDGVRDDLTRLAANPLVKGVRRITQAEPDPEFCNQPAFVAGVRALAEYGFTCDLCITHEQLAATTRLVASCPDVHFILDHLGKPDVRGGLRQPWASDLRALADLPNAWCKLSGVVTEADHENWTFDDIQFYLDGAIATFGPDRLIYGGDWPVVTLAAAYRQWVDCVNQALTALSASDRADILTNNARTFYRLGDA